MQLLMIIVFATATYFRDSITSIDSYSLFTEMPSIEYELATKDEQGNNLSELNYKPHISSFLGLSATHKNITYSFLYQSDEKEKENAEESRLFDMQFQGAYEKVLWHLFYQNYHGLYITDSDIDSSDLPNANSYSYGIGLKYFPRDGYSLQRSLSNFSNKKETNWSWYHGLSYNKFKLYSDDTLIPSAYESNFSQLKGLTEFETTSLGYEFGLTGIFSFGNFFIDILFGPGVQLQKQEFTGIDQEPRFLTDSINSVMADIGYDAKFGSFGFQVNSQSTNIPIKDSVFTSTRSTARFYYKYFF